MTANKGVYYIMRGKRKSSFLLKISIFIFMFLSIHSDLKQEILSATGKKIYSMFMILKVIISLP